jgi:hypothetical protein
MDVTMTGIFQHPLYCYPELWQSKQTSYIGFHGDTNQHQSRIQLHRYVLRHVSNTENTKVRLHIFLHWFFGCFKLEIFQSHLYNWKTFQFLKNFTADIFANRRADFKLMDVTVIGIFQHPLYSYPELWQSKQTS